MFIEEASRQEQISVLEAAADRDYDDEDFNYLLAVFDLPIQCIDDLKHLIYSEKWRRSRRPFDYVRNKILRESIKSETDSDDPHEICASEIFEGNHEAGLSRLKNEHWESQESPYDSDAERLLPERFMCYRAPTAKDAEDLQMPLLDQTGLA